MDKKPKAPKAPKTTRRERKANEMYKANPTWATEDDYRPKKMKTGGIKKSSTTSAKPKMKMGGAKKPLAKAQFGRAVGKSGVKAGPLTEYDSQALDYLYPSTSMVSIPSAPQDYIPYGPNDKNGAEMEMQGRGMSEKNIRSSGKFNKESIYKKGGATRKMQKGGSNVIQSMRKNILAKREGRLIDKGVANIKAGNVEKGKAQLKKSDDVGYKRRHIGDKYKTGGMVNSNKKVSAAKVAKGSVGGVSKAISKVAVKSASPKGRVGGTSKAPRTATPKAKMGGMMKGKKC